MGTSNFASNINAQNIYAVLLNETDPETGEIIIPDEYELEFLEEAICDSLEQKGYQIFDGDGWNGDRNYAAHSFAKIDQYKGEVGIRTELIVRSGYYEGATLDYLFEFEFEGETFDSIEWLREVLDEGELNEKDFAWLEKQKEIISKDIEKVYTENSTVVKLFAAFSNGETIYVKN